MASLANQPWASPPTPPQVPTATLNAVDRLLRDAPRRLGPAALLGVDGPSGSGKSVAAAAISSRLAARHADVRVLCVEDHYDGWAGLGGAPVRVADLLERLASGRSATYRAYDWHGGAFGAQVQVPALGADSIVVLEGVGAGAAPLARFRSALVWVEAPSAMRLRRAVERDGEEYAGRLRAWARSEALHFAAHDTRRAADLRLDEQARLSPEPSARRMR